MEINQIVGQNLKRIRIEKHLTLEQLEKLTDVSKGMLSQIEKGTTNPTINTIWKLAEGLNISYSTLLDTFNENPQVIRKEEAIHQISNDGFYQLWGYFTGNRQRNFELFQMMLEPNKFYTSIGHSKKSEEYILVTKGKLSLSVAGKKYVLKEQDALNFVATTEHTYSNLGEEQVQATIINYYS